MLCLWEPPIFDLPQIQAPLTSHIKIVTGDYVSDSYPETKFGANMGANRRFQAKHAKIQTFVFLQLLHRLQPNFAQ